MLIMLRSLSYGQQLQQGSISIGQFGPYAQSISDRIEEFERDPQSGGSQLLPRIDLVRFDRVDFGYSEREQVLQRVDVSIERGQIIGLVGPSGSGKTSFVHMLLGLYEPTQGSIRVNGIDLRDIDRESWHRLVAYVPQETNLITGTIRENVRFLRSEITDSSIDATLLRAGLDLDPTIYPSGSETNLGEAGRQFSGGQRQRLAIARALVTNPSLLVLDEPTSALDAESEEVILETLDKLRGEVTIVVITHRTDTLRVCDRVFRITDRSVREESGQPGL